MSTFPLFSRLDSSLVMIIMCSLGYADASYCNQKDIKFGFLAQLRKNIKICS